MKLNVSYYQGQKRCKLGQCEVTRSGEQVLIRPERGKVVWVPVSCLTEETKRELNKGE